MKKATDKKSLGAAAKLHRLAQVTAALRLYREHHGHDAPGTVAIAVWVQRHRIKTPIEPSPADHDQVGREHPDLVLLANRSNPYLSGPN